MEAEFPPASAIRHMFRYYAALLAEGREKSGKVPEALTLLQSTLETVTEPGLGFYISELYRLQGICLLRAGESIRTNIAAVARDRWAALTATTVIRMAASERLDRPRRIVLRRMRNQAVHGQKRPHGNSTQSGHSIAQTTRNAFSAIRRCVHTQTTRAGLPLRFARPTFVSKSSHYALSAAAIAVRS